MSNYMERSIQWVIYGILYEWGEPSTDLLHLGTQRDPPTKSTTQASRKEKKRERHGEKKIDRDGEWEGEGDKERASYKAWIVVVAVVIRQLR